MKIVNARTERYQMRKDITKYTQNLVGFQVVSEKVLLSDTMEVAELSRLACLPIRRLRKATINVWIERTKFKCPHCGSEEVSIYFERHRMARGGYWKVANGKAHLLKQ